MGNRITFDEICQQLCSIYRVTLCCFQNEVQNDSPYLVRYGPLESVIGNLSKEAADGFIRFKSLHCTQDVILHHCQSEASNLSGKMYRLAFAKVQQGLTILVCNFGSSSSGINTIRFKEAKRKVCGQQPIPVSLASSFAKEQTDWHAIQLDVHCTIGTAKHFVVFACLFLLLVLSLLTMKREIKKKLANAIGQHHGQTLITKDALLMNMRPDSSYEFGRHTSLRCISIINNQTNRLVMMNSCAA